MSDSENSEDEKVVVREERYVNDQGKTVIRRVYKKKKHTEEGSSKRTSKTATKKKTAKSPRKFEGVPKDGDEDENEFGKVKLRSRAPPKRDDDDDVDESVPEWQRVKLKSKNTTAPATNGGKEGGEGEVKDFRQMLKKRDNGGGGGDGAEKSSNESGGVDFRSMLKKRSTGGEEKAPAEKEGESGGSSAAPDFRSMLKKKSTNPVEVSAKDVAEEKTTPNFLGVLKKSNAVAASANVAVNEKKEDENAAPWRVKLRPTSTKTDLAPDQSISTSPVDKIPAPDPSNDPFQRKLSSGSSRASKVDPKESEQKANERRLLRLQSEAKKAEEARAKNNNNSDKSLADLQAQKSSLQNEIDQLLDQKKSLLSEVEVLKEEVAKYKSQLESAK